MDHPDRHTHPVLTCARVMSRAVQACDQVEAVFMTAPDKQTALLELTRVIDQVTELRARILVEAGDVAAESGARDAAAWLSGQTRAGRAAGGWLGQARALARWSRVAAGVREGNVNLAQARVITHALDRLPDDVDPDLRDRCEAHLVAQAAHFAPEQLLVLGRRILDVLDPDAAESREAEALDKEERDAARRTYLRWRRNGDRTTDFTGRVSDTVFDRLRTYLEAFTNPRKTQRTHTQDTDTGDTDTGDTATEATATEATATEATATEATATEATATGATATGATATGDTATGDTGFADSPIGPSAPTGTAGPGAPSGSPDDRRPYDQRMGAALGAFLEAVDPTRLPLHGGDATTVIVTIDYDTLRDQLAGIGLIGDQPITAAHARRLACQAKILPAVLSGASEILDLGRTRRLATPAQRKALALRHPHCQATGCDIPATWCEAHHHTPWSTGGHTDLDGLILLCSFHHHRAHDTHYDTTQNFTGDISFHRRT